jgi:hypothetical protein
MVVKTHNTQVFQCPLFLFFDFLYARHINIYTSYYAIWNNDVKEEESFIH